MRQKDVIGPAPNVKRLGFSPRSPAFTNFIVGFLQVPITVGILLSTEPSFTLTPQTLLSQLKTNVKGIIRVSKLQGIDLFYYLLDLRERTNSNDVHKSLVGALF